MLNSGYPILEYEENEEDEEFIAIPVCEEFVKHFLKGTLKTLSEIGYLNTFVWFLKSSLWQFIQII